MDVRRFHCAVVTMSSPARHARPWGGALRSVLALVLIVWLGGYLIHRRDLLAKAWQIPWPVLLVILLCVCLTWYARTLQLGVLLRALGTSASTWHLLILGAGTTCLNYLPLNAGFAAGAVWLRQQCGLRYSRFMSQLVATFGLAEVAAGVLGLVGLLGAPRLGSACRYLLLAAFVLAAVLPVVICYIPPPRWLARGRLGRATGRFVVGLSRIAGNRPALLHSLLIQFAIHVVQSARLYIIFRACGVDFDPGSALILQSLTVCVPLAVFTPGGLGVREGLLALASGWLGFGMDAGLLVAGIDRAAVLLSALVLGMPSVVWMARQMVAPVSPGNANQTALVEV